jgi:hypothetical protein
VHVRSVFDKIGWLIVRYAQFKQAVRAYAPSTLLPAVAAKSSAITASTLAQGSVDSKSVERNVAYSAIARVSLLFGNEHRDKRIDDASLERLVSAFREASDPLLSPDLDVWALVAAFMYEQFPYQYPAHDELTRSYLMLCETSVDESVSYPDAEAWKDLLGATIEEAFSAAFLFYVSAMHNGGFVDTSFLEDERYQNFEQSVPVESAKNVLRLLTATIDEVKDDASVAAGKAKVASEFERFDYNPLTKTPIINLGTQGLLAPQAEFIFRSMQPENLYYRGMRKWADRQFGKAYGFRVEAYTGMQLEHTGKHHVEPEFKYLKSGSEAASSDWFLITPDATVIIECKSARMSLVAKAGTEALPKVFEEHVSKAIRQLDDNASRILNRDAAFSHIPNDKPLIGLIVTAEPLYTANDPIILSKLRKPGIPVLTVSLKDIENLSTLEPEDLGRALKTVAEDEDSFSWNVSSSVLNALELSEFPPNRLILDTFEKVFLPSSTSSQQTV